MNENDVMNDVCENIGAEVTEMIELPREEDLPEGSHVETREIDGRTIAVIVTAAGAIIGVWEGGKWLFKKAIIPGLKKATGWVKGLFKKKETVIAVTTAPDGTQTVSEAKPVQTEQTE